MHQRADAKVGPQAVSLRAMPAGEARERRQQKSGQKEARGQKEGEVGMGAAAVLHDEARGPQQHETGGASREPNTSAGGLCTRGGPI